MPTITENMRVRMATEPTREGVVKHVIGPKTCWVRFDGEEQLTPVNTAWLEPGGMALLRKLEPAHQTATTRREKRREIRNRLGTSSDDAPGAEVTIRACAAMLNLLEQATDYKLSLRIVDKAGNVVTLADALAWARGELAER